MTTIQPMTLNQFEAKIKHFGLFTSAFYPDKDLHLVLDKAGHRRFLIRLFDEDDNEIELNGGAVAVVHKFDQGRFSINSYAHSLFDDFSDYIKLLQLVTAFSLTDPEKRQDYTVSKWEIKNTKHDRIKERQAQVEHFEELQKLQSEDFDDDDSCDCDDDDYDDEDDDF